MVEVKLHDIGEGMTEADINCFLVKAGDVVKADDPLVEVQTDKMTAEIPAPRAGVIKQILLKAGETVKVGSTLLIMEDLAEQEHHSFIDDGEKRGMKRILASPYTRKIAREHHVDLANVSGSGIAGRITDEDVYTFIKQEKQKSALKNSEQGSEKMVLKDSEHGSERVVSRVSEQGSEERVLKDSKHSSESVVLNDSQTGFEGNAIAGTQSGTGKQASSIPFRGRRKQIAKKMVQSLYTIPHCTHFEEIDMGNLLKFHEELKAKAISISVTAFFIKALSICLKEFPVFNGKLDEENEIIHLLEHHHIGVAVDVADGLVVPVIRNVEQKNVKQINGEMKKLTQLAIDGKLEMAHLTGGTFTVSNVGPLGGSIGATPIIQHPQTALISFHKTKKRPVVNEHDEIVIRPIMNLSMAFDHRVADGAAAVSFTNRFSEIIENPNMMLLELM